MSVATEPDHNKRNLVRQLLLCTGAAWIVSEPAILTPYAEFPWLRLGAFVILSAATMKGLAAVLRKIARRVEYLQANRPTSLKGSAGFLRDRKLRRLCQKAGMFLGARRCGPRGREYGIIRDFSSNAAVIGPSGSGKGHTVLCNTMLTLPVTAGRVSVDLKFENFDILEPPLTEQGLKVALLDLGNLDTKGRGEFFNPLSIIADLFWEAGGLTIITEQSEELAHELYGEPAEGDDANIFFRDGARMLIVLTILITIIIDGDDATLGSVSQLLNDRDKLRATLELVCGKLPLAPGHPVSGQDDQSGEVEFAPPLPIEDAPWVTRHSEQDVANFVEWLRASASGELAMLGTRTGDSFLSGARMALRPFDVTSHVNKVMSKTTIDLAALKNQDAPLALFIALDARRIERQRHGAKLLLWCAQQIVKRIGDANRPVYFVYDECTNYEIDKLQSQVTFSRAYGQRNLLIWQSNGAFEITYGKECLGTILSECEIIHFLPGQQEPETTELIENLLGQESVMAASFTVDQTESKNVEGSQISEEARPLLTQDEIRRCQFAITFMRGEHPSLSSPASYSEIHPLRDKMGINRFFGKPFRQKVRLRLPFRKIRNRKGGR